MSDRVSIPSELMSMLRAASARIESERRLPHDVFEAIARAGLFRLALPRSIGGPERSPREIVEAVERVSIADASAGWCVGIFATTGLTAAYLPTEMAREVFGDPIGVACGVFAPTGTGVREGDGYRVRGRWAFASGCDHAAWRMISFMVDRDGTPTMVQAFVPAASTRIVDTWHASGLRGTGSHDVVVEDALVPDRYTFSLFDAPRESGALYRFPVFGLLSLAVASVTLGIARASIDAFVELAKTKKQAGSSRTLAERETTQTTIGHAEASLRAARMLVLGTIDEVAEKTDAMSIVDRVAVRLAATHAAERAVHAIDLVQRMAGSASVYDAQPFGRFHRDAHVATQHLMISDTTYTMCGRALMGLPVQTNAL
jgi:alkylation response protein AidB-like acyl-CoA dehydrogenase